MTPEERQQYVATRLYVKKQGNINWGTIISSIASADSVAKQAIIDAAIAKDHGALANALMGLVLAKLQGDADTEAAAILADSTLTLEELDAIL